MPIESSMNIDLLFNAKGECGLLSSENFVKKLVGVVFDTAEGMLSLEFTDMSHMDLNIPVEPDYFNTLEFTPLVQIGSVVEGKISQAYQVPLMLLDDPYRAAAFKNVKVPTKPLESFYYFVKNCVVGQPVHRDDAGDESTAGCILGDAQPSSLEFAPHLARRHTLEVMPSADLNLSGPGLGLGGSSGGGGARAARQTVQRSQQRKDEGE